MNVTTVAVLPKSAPAPGVKRLKRAISRTSFYRGVVGSFAYQTLIHAWKLLRSADYRSNDRIALADFRRFRDLNGGRGLRHDVSPRGGKRKTALIVRNAPLPYVTIESFLWKGLQMAGFDTIVAGFRRYDFLRYDRLAGNRMVVEQNDFGYEEDPEWIDQQMPGLKTLNDWVALEYRGVHVGRFVVSLAQRRYRGRLDYADPEIQKDLRFHLALSVRRTIAGARMLDELKPDCVLVNDRGYSGPGEIFDLAVNRGIDTLTWNLGYKSDRIVVKRYHSDNERDHPLAPSKESWRQICSIPWSPEKGNTIRKELFDCYQTQDWFSMVGTQFDKKILTPDQTRRQLGLSSDKKVAVIFPHILWDGSLFWGKDLFSDYTHWFIETVKAAAANPNVQWIVKVHPAHLTKAKQNGDPERPMEYEVIERSIGKLPGHVTLVHPEDELSTYSLFQIADYVVTVRGTVGIESGLFGIPVVTAGTGRYDGRGFSLDSSTQQEYLEKLATLETYPPLSPEEVELAERYAYGVFLCRPLVLSSVSLGYERDGKSTPKVRVNHQSREQWIASEDMKKLSAWMNDRNLEDMLDLPPVEHPVASAYADSPVIGRESPVLIG